MPSRRQAGRSEARKERLAAAYEKEAKALAQIERETGIPLLTDWESCKIPYSHSGRKFRADAVWMAPEGSPIKGICIELQGMGKHSRSGGMTTDGIKSCIAQMGGFFVWAAPYKGIEKMLPVLTAMYIAAGEAALHKSDEHEDDGWTHADV